ncbi:MAG: hypothetical protein Tsb002_00990 [Wenzhouxiangellaceae bacterium]
MNELTETLSRSQARLELATEYRLQAAELQAGAEGLIRLRLAVQGANNLNLRRNELLGYIDKRLIDINAASDNMLSNANYYEETAIAGDGGNN